MVNYFNFFKIMIDNEHNALKNITYFSMICKLVLVVV